MDKFNQLFRVLEEKRNSPVSILKRINFDSPLRAAYLNFDNVHGASPNTQKYERINEFETFNEAFLKLKERHVIQLKRKLKNDDIEPFSILAQRRKKHFIENAHYVAVHYPMDKERIFDDGNGKNRKKRGKSKWGKCRSFLMKYVEDCKNDSKIQEIKRRIKRTKARNEILETEKYYVEALKILILYYLEPLKNEKILTEEEMQNVFLNSKEILELNSAFLEDVKGAYPNVEEDDSEEEVLLGPIISEHLEKFKNAYALFMQKYPQAIQTISKISERNEKFAEFLKITEKKLTEMKHRTSTLQSYLIQPVQRIPRYVLLIRELLKYTDEDHPDYNCLSDALTLGRKVAEFCNTKIREAENEQKLKELEELYKLELTSNNRVLIKTGPVIIAQLKAQLYLVTGMLIIEMDSVLLKKNRITCIDFNEPELSISKLNDPSIPKGHYAFILETNRKQFTFLCKTEEERDSWVSECNKTLGEIKNTLPPSDEEIIVKEGWLKKEGASSRSLRRRWHVLTNKKMKYFDKQGGLMKGSYSISGRNFSVPDDYSYFKIHTPERVYFLKSESREEMNSWIEALQKIGCKMMHD